MEKTLRKKFILTSMAAVCISLFLIFGAIAASSFIEIGARADRTIDIIIDNGGQYPRPDALNEESMNNAQIGGAAPKNGKTNSASASFLTSPEDPFSTRYFTVTADSDGNIQSVDTDSIYAVSAAEAVELANEGEIFSKVGKSGYLSNYRYSVVSSGEGKLAVFLDISRDMSMYSRYMRNAGIILVISLALIYAAAYFLSGKAVKPIVDSYERQKEFITNAGHELKTPLAIIKTNNSVMEMKFGRASWTENIDSQVDRMNALVNRMVSIMRLDEEGFVMKCEDLDMSLLLREKAEEFAALASANNNRFKTDIQDGVRLRADRELMNQLVGILLDNAVKYSEAGGEISLSLHKSDKVIFEITNPSEGLSAGKYDWLLERFTRLDEHRNSLSGGHGLGLSMAKLIVEKHNGSIKAGSADGKNMTIRITI